MYMLKGKNMSGHADGPLQAKESSLGETSPADNPRKVRK
jgi:hypothetical protein